jgi:hypothetical protein
MSIDRRALPVVPDQQLPLALHLPRLHSLVLGNRASWLALPGELRLNHLEDLDLQECYLDSIPTQLRLATALRRLRIADEGAGLLITPTDLDTLSALRSLTFLSLTQPHRPPDKCTPAGPFEIRSWGEHSLQDLCWILWELRARSLVVVLEEPCNVAVPLAVAATLPADAMGRCALTTGGIADRFRRAGVTPKPWRSCSSDEEQVLWAALEGLIPARDMPLADIAEVDGAAAMWAAIPGHVSDWMQLQVDAKSRRG